MTGWLWGLVAVLAVGIFGLGAVAARIMMLHRGGLMDDGKVEAILAVAFTVLAVAIGADTVTLHVRFDHYIHAQVDCNTRQLETQIAIDKQRRSIDQAAANYDLSMMMWLTKIRESTENGAAPISADDPAYAGVQKRLHELAIARTEMLEVYANHPTIVC